MNTDNQRSVLIVEDSNTMATALGDTLKVANFSAHIANNGEEGLEYAKKNKPDLIIIDLMLGRMSGVDVLKEIRQDLLWGSRVPIIVLTNLPYLEKMSEVKKLSNKYISKGDFEMSSLVSIVNSVLPQNSRSS